MIGDDTLRELPVEFVGVGEVRGFVFRQVSRTMFGYIYEVRVPGKEGCHYEVFRRMENARFGCVSYPKSKSFGAWAWCCDSLAKARERLKGFEEFPCEDTMLTDSELAEEEEEFI